MPKSVPKSSKEIVQYFQSDMNKVLSKQQQEMVKPQVMLSEDHKTFSVRFVPEKSDTGKVNDIRTDFAKLLNKNSTFTEMGFFTSVPNTEEGKSNFTQSVRKVSQSKEGKQLTQQAQFLEAHHKAVDSAGKAGKAGKTGKEEAQTPEPNERTPLINK